MKTRSLSKRPLGFEQLESRAMLAGDVQAVVGLSGNLELLGDTLSNLIAVTQKTNGQWKVQGLLGTTVNGSTSQKFTVPGGIDADMGNGNDAIAVLNGIFFGGIDIHTGNGIDGVALANLRAWSLTVNTGAHSDGVFIANVFIEAPDQNGDIETTFVQPTLGDAKINTSSGDDLVLIAKLTASSICVLTGDGRDAVGLIGVVADGRLKVNMGSGNFDILGIAKSRAGFADLHGGGNTLDICVTARNSFGSQTSSGFQFKQSLDPLADQIERLIKMAGTLVQQLPSIKSLPKIGL